MASPTDPTDIFAALFGEWRKLAGGAAGDDPPGGGMPPAFRSVAERALGAANVPSKSDLEALSSRIGRMEAALFRIEALLTDLAAAPVRTVSSDEDGPPA